MQQLNVAGNQTNCMSLEQKTQVKKKTFFDYSKVL